MIHDSPIRFSFSNQAQFPARAVLICIGGELIRLEPGETFGPAVFFLEENELLLFEPENMTPLILQWTENNKLVLPGSSAWKSGPGRNKKCFELSAGSIPFIIRYRLKVKNRNSITLKFSAHTLTG